VSAGTQIHIPIEISVDPDRYAYARQSLNVETLITAFVPSEAFCAMVDAGFVRADLAYAEVTTSIAGVEYPVPSEVRVLAPELPIFDIDFADACAGALGPEVEVGFSSARTTVTSNGLDRIEFWLTADSIDVGFTNLEHADATMTPGLSLLELCTPMDKSEPLNGLLDDPEDSPRIAADTNGDGTYDAWASPQDQIRISVQGGDPCVGFPCDDGNECTDDVCEPADGSCTNTAIPDGETCDLGGGSGACVDSSCQPSQLKTVSMGCTNGVTSAQEALPFELSVTTTPVKGGAAPQEFTAELHGTGRVPQFFLDAAQSAVPGGLRSAIIEGFTSTVSVRSGATGPDVQLGIDELALIPGPTRFCLFPGTTVCTVDSDCVVPPCRPPILSIDLPVSEDCGPGGVCEGLHQGFSNGPGAQCNITSAPTFCVTGDLVLPMAPDTGVYTPDASGVALFGWAEDPATSVCDTWVGGGCPANGGTVPGGGLILPAAIYGDPVNNPASVGLNGIRLNIGGALFIALQCSMAEAGGACDAGDNAGLACATSAECPGGICVLAENVLVPSRDAALIHVAIENADPIECNGADCNDGNYCTADSCDPTAGACVHAPAAEGFPCSTGGFPGTCVSGSCVSACESLSCDDNEQCTMDSCNYLYGRCDNLSVADETICDFFGVAGACEDGQCKAACLVLNCDDYNDCTADSCSPSSGTCSNIVVTDGSSCDYGGFPGVCSSGICEDAMLCAGVDCDDGNVCTSDSCDPMDGLCDNDAVLVPTACDFFGLPGSCSDDQCVSSCELLDCDDGDDCTDDTCNPYTETCINAPSAEGALCDAGFGECQAEACVPAAPQWTSKTKTVTVGCYGTLGQALVPFELEVSTTPIIGGPVPRAFTAEIGGTAFVPESMLNFAQGVVTGGARTARLDALTVGTSVRSGARMRTRYCLFPSTQVCASDADCLVPPCQPPAVGSGYVSLGVDESLLPTAPTRLCTYPTNQICTSDSDCIVPPCLPPVDMIEIPHSSDCAVGGVCDLLGKTGAASQCEANGFCVTGSLALPLATSAVAYESEESGVVLFGWTSGWDAIRIDLRLGNSSSLSLHCEMAVGANNTFGIEDAEFSPTPDSALLSFAIDSSQPVWCDGINCNDGLPCTVDTCDLANGSCQNLPAADDSACDLGGFPGVCLSGACIAVCNTVSCEDLNECTSETCDPNDGLCHRNLLEGSSCDFAGLAGACASGVCQSACEVVGCDDANDCTTDICDPVTAACVNPIVVDGSACDFGGFPGVCLSGECEDAMLCDGVNCDDGNICTDDSCDPMDGLCDHLPQPSSVSCNFEGLAGACVAGDCVSACEVVDCDDGVECTDNACDPVDASCSNDISPDNAHCDAGFGRCESGVCIPAAPEWSSKTQLVTVGCTNGVTDAQDIQPYEMTVRTTPIEGGVAPRDFTAEVGGAGVFPKFFLDAAQTVVPGGLRSAIIEGFTATVSVRSGATGPDVQLGIDESAVVPGRMSFCAYPPDEPCTVDTDCEIVPLCQPPVLLIDLPIAEDCGPGGVCEGLGQGFADGPSAQCNITSPPEFCVTGDLLLPMAAEIGVYTPRSSGDVIFGWAEDPATEVCGTSGDGRCATNGGTIPDGGLILPPSIYGLPLNVPTSVGLSGIRLNFGGALFVALQCSAGSDGGACVAGANAGLACASDSDCPGSTCAGVGVNDDIIVPSPDSALISFPIDATPAP
jgi:hypothetical protein